METTEGGGKQVLNSLSRVLNNMNMSAILGGSGGGQQTGARTSSSSAGGSSTDGGAEAVSTPPSASDADTIVKKGYLKKYKNLKSRFFVLRRHTSPTNPATLEYYDNEAKFLGNQKPRRQFPLNQCIGVQEKRDSKLPFAVDIFIKQDSHCLVAASQKDSEEWLQALQTSAITSHDGHVWPVEVLKRGLGGSGLKVPTGPCYLILAPRQLAVVHQTDYNHRVDITLNTIRRCYITEEYFCLEMGRLASTGSGTLSLKTQDSNISDNIDKLVKKAMNDQVLTRNRTFSVSSGEGTRTTPRDRSDSLPARPSSSIGGGCPTVPLSNALTSGGPFPPPLLQHLGIEGVGVPTSQELGKSHYSPWEMNSRRTRHVDDGRGGGCLAMSPEMTAPHCICGGMRGTLPTHQEGANESENYLNMSPNQQQPLPCSPHGVPLLGCQHQFPCESGSSSRCISTFKVDPPLGMGGDPTSSLTSPNSNDYLDMGRGFPSSVSSPPNPSSSLLSPRGCQDPPPSSSSLLSPKGYQDPSSSSLLSPRGCQDRDGGCANCNRCGHGGFCPIHRVADTCGGGANPCSTNHQLPCCCGSHYCGSSSGSSRSRQQQTLNSGSSSRRPQQQQQGFMPPPAIVSSSQPDGSWDSGNYMDMTPTNPTQPKPIPGCLVEGDLSPSTACSSFTSCAGTPSSDRFGRPHSSSNVYSPDEGPNNKQQPHCCVVHHNLDSPRSSNQDALSNMDTDSVPDVEDSVDDILDGMHPETRRRLDSMDRPSADGGSDRGSGNGLDDMDLDMDMDTDQVDSGAGTTTNSVTTSNSMIGGGSRGGSVSARACLETVVASSCGGGIGCSCGGRPPVPLLRDEDELMSLERPFRTSSVGSKQDFSRRKNRHLEMPSSSSVFSCNEPSRVRAFSVGSRVSLKLLGGLSGGSSCRHNGGGGATSPGAPCGGGGAPFGHGSGCACATSTASSTSSTPLSGAARFLSQQYKGGGGLVPGENNYIGGQHSGSSQQHTAAYCLMNHGAISPSSSCSSSSSFSPYPEFCSPTGGPLGSAQGTDRTVKSKSTSAPMLGISCASRSWSDTSGSYFRNLFTPRSSQHERQREDLMYLDFTKNHKSSDHIAAHLHEDGASSSKDKKSLSIEKIMSTFKHRSSTKLKNKRGVSEGDTSSMSSKGGIPGGGGAIEIPSNHSDYFQMDFNPSPRSNNSNTSTNSDVPLAGYLPLRHGASLSFSSTCSTDYVDMDRGAVVSMCSNNSEVADGGYLLMSSPRTSIDMFYTPPTSSVLEGYVDMTQGPGGLSISADSSSSGSLSSRHRKTSNSYSTHVSSIEMPSPKEEFPQFSYLHEIDPKGQQKDKKKGRRKSIKESSKRKKSDPGTGDSISETIKSKGSSHLATFSSFLTRKNSQSSSAKTPLSPNGSPLPKSSRSSNSPFASLGRKSSSKESRDKSNPPVSQSPSSGLATAIIPPGFPSSPSNFSSGFLHGTPLTPGFVDSEASENENYYSMEAAAADGLVSLPFNPGSFPRNHSNKELGSFELNKQAPNRSSGSFDSASASLLTGSAGVSEVSIISGGGGCSAVSSSLSPCCNNHHQHFCHCGRTEAALCNAMSQHNYHHQHHHCSLHHHCPHHHSSSLSCELKDRGEQNLHDDAQNAYVNFSSGPDSSSLPANAISFCDHRKTCCCSNNNSSSCCNNYTSSACNNSSSRHSSCPRLTSVDKLGQMEHGHHGSGSSRPSSELGRLSESSLEDGRPSNACSPPQSVAQETASYVNMCPLNAREKLSVIPNLARINAAAPFCEASKSASNTPRTGTPCNERKILNTDQTNRGSLVLDYTSDYLEMDMRKACLHKSNNSHATCSHLGSGSSSSMTSSSPCVSTAVSGAAPLRGVVKRPALPPLLLGARTDPSVPLEKLSLTERLGGGGGAGSTVTNPESSSTPLGSSDCANAGSCDRTTSSNNNTSLATPNVSCSQDCRAAGGENDSCSSGSSSERCRSHSGPGAPEASRLGGQGSKDFLGLDVCEEVRRGEGEGKTQSVCSSPVSYSPPTSPSLASSSKSSLSEGGLSSASSTCTVVNVGLRLQQQQNRQSQGSGSSISNNTDCLTSTALLAGSCVIPSPYTTPTSTNTPDVTSSSRSSALSTAASAGLFTVSRASQIRQVVSQLPRAAQSSSQTNQARDGSSTTTTTTSSIKPTVFSTSQNQSSSSVEGQQDVVYAYLELAPPKRDIIHSGGSGSPASKRRLMPASSTLQGSGEEAASSVSSSAGVQTGDDTVDNCQSGTGSTPPSNYVEIDFKKSESLRNACMIRDALRH